jgi:hypothetical protein
MSAETDRTAGTASLALLLVRPPGLRGGGLHIGGEVFDVPFLSGLRGRDQAAARENFQACRGYFQSARERGFSAGLAKNTV